jgi:hypothetical protein
MAAQFRQSGLTLDRPGRYAEHLSCGYALLAGRLGACQPTTLGRHLVMMIQDGIYLPS